MKTHDLAKALTLLARLLKSGPNTDLEELTSLNSQRRRGRGEALVGLSTLANLAKVDKQQWITIINDHGFSIEVRPRDASRDLIGKLLTYLEQNPEARKQINESARRQSTNVSPELTRALSILLHDQ